ncbi:MAG: hypothetical protein WDN23_19410 [Edaphobacter sp.]
MKPLPHLRVSAGLLALALLPLSAAFAAVANPDAAAQEASGFGPLDTTPPTGITVEEIIKKFGERESTFSKARENYTFRQSVKVDTISEDTNRVDGEYQQITDITFNNDGKREEHVVFAPQNTLERVLMTPADFDEIEQPPALHPHHRRSTQIHHRLPRPPARRRPRHLRLRRRPQNPRKKAALLSGKGLGRPAGPADRPHQR